MRTFDHTETSTVPSAEEIRAVAELIEEPENPIADPPLFEPKTLGDCMLVVSHGEPKAPRSAAG
ncbi:hypothetical protein [Actinoalloteichus hymeniacidonis]|uniref:Uncharacterized protein n=1 Tax=Actinoalloteichus hymeniacidonis TaxID=340345 RepID=A0AAC9MZ80_9PSEU|nr:hypothetical protein [Actinoalloteichus hymeniacidonis]AOS63661.1 hypothetical protein TL08_14235 [Actinoalloteichus hymeniacidonis]MBB5908291.1 hypothetical protein [Actinoalloteichus hymeniacidonis]